MILEKHFGISSPKAASEEIESFGTPDLKITNEDLEFLTSRVKKINCFALGDRGFNNQELIFLSQLRQMRKSYLRHCLSPVTPLLHPEAISGIRASISGTPIFHQMP